MYFSKKIIILPLFISAFVFANTDAKDVVLRYKKAMDSRDKKELEQTVTDSYYKTLNKNDTIDRLFKEKKIENQQYKVEIIESKVVKNGYMAKVTNKSDKSVEWYKLAKTKDGFKIEKKVSDH